MNYYSMAKRSHIVVISVPLLSHQSSIIELCKRLIHLHNHIHITCIFPTIDAPIPATLKLLESLPSSINYIFLPPINLQDLPHEKPSLLFLLAVSQSLPFIRKSLINSLCSTTNTPPVALIVDLMATQTLELAKEFNLLSFVYFPISTMVMSLFLHLPTLHKQISCEYKDHTEPIQLPGCNIPISGQDFPPNFFHDRSSIVYEMTLQYCKRFSIVDGFLVNSFSKMEEISEHNNKLVYMVGPIIQSGSNNSDDSIFLKWLENQTPNSVLYVCFGSGGTLSQQQLNELALGLELSGQKFLWVLRAPTPDPSTYVAHNNGANSAEEILKFLPNGFLERTKEQGLVVPLWAPQTKILSHTSTGGFLTHCGWNSTLESIVLGVPMITWPLFGDQRMNAILLTEELKVGLKVKYNESGIADKEEISKVIRDLMMGDERSEIQQRIKELQDAAVGALREDGSSTMALSQFGIQMENLLLEKEI